MRTQTLITTARILAALVMASFAVLVVLPRGGDRVTAVVTAVVAVALAMTLAVAHRRGNVRPGAAVVTVTGGFAVAGAELYLLSLDPDGADIPLAGVGILFLGLVAVTAGGLMLARPRVH